MNAEGFKNWLLASGLKKSTAEDRVANCATVEREQRVDLDACYAKDRCEHLLDLLTYSRDDQRRNNRPRHRIPIDGDMYNGTATYKAAVKKYVAYKDAGGAVQVKPPSHKKVPPKVEAKLTVTGAARDTNDINDKFKNVLKHFQKWLSDEAGLESTSANQYKTYINKLCAAADRHFGPGWFESLPLDYFKSFLEDKLLRCSGLIEEMIRDAPKTGRKSWRDWRSAFHRFEEYLHDVANIYVRDFEKFSKENAARHSAKSSRNTQQAKLQLKTAGVEPRVVIAATYTHNELARAFMGRLKTQSRYYPRFKLLFPPRLLTKIFKHCKRNAWIEWLKNDLVDMRILSQNTSPVSFSDIKKFEFCEDGTVAVTRNDGMSFKMMTHTAEGGIMEECAKRGLRDVSIDHVVPLETILRRNKDRLKGLSELTSLFVEFSKNVNANIDPRAEREWVNEFFDRYREHLDTDSMRTKIEQDLAILELEYELMDTRENSKKGNGDNR